MEKCASHEIRTEAVNPHILTVSDFTAINEVTQDMWTYGIGELAQCHTCEKILSKKDVFWNLSKDIYEKTVTKIMNILWMENIICPSCKWETKLIYGPENILKYKKGF